MNQEVDKNKYLVDMDVIEPFCIALRIHSTIVYAYPVMEEVLKHNPKVITKLGKVVKKLQIAVKDNERLLTGLIDDERLVWDIRGNFIGEDPNEDLKLYCPERYFMRNWKQLIKLSNSEFALKYQRRHPYAKLPEKRTNYYKGEL